MTRFNHSGYFPAALLLAASLLLPVGAALGEEPGAETDPGSGTAAGVEEPAPLEGGEEPDLPADTGEPPAQSQEDDAAAAPVPPADPIRDYMDAIERVEISHGAYSLELADLYLGLGNLLLKEQQFAEAKDVLQKGMQVARVNNGLEDLSQEAFLYSLADLDIALGDASGSNTAMHHILHINSETYGATNEPMLPALERMLDWYLDRYPLLGAQEGYQYLLNAEKLAAHMVTIHRDTLEHYDDGAPDAYRKLSAVEFALARHVDAHGLPGQQEAFAYSFGAPQNQLPPEPSHVDRHYRAGRDALKMSVSLINERPGASKQELAEAVLELADWYAAFDKHAAAEEHYLLAHQLLGEAEGGADLQQSYFAEPRLITFPPVAVAGHLAADEGLPVTLDISDRGVPGNLRLEETDDSLGVRERREIRKAVLKSRFRPQLEGGVPVGTKDYVYHYPLAGVEARDES